MKTLLIGETRQGELLEGTYELPVFARLLGGECAMMLVGTPQALPAFEGRVYLADAGKYGDYNPEAHKRLVLEAAKRWGAECIIFLHSSHGWDLAPRVAAALKAAQASEVTGVVEGAFEVPCCNGKMRRLLRPQTTPFVVTLQPGAFVAEEQPQGTPQVEALDLPEEAGRLEFLGYETAASGGQDLVRAAVIVTAGRGVGRKENVEAVAALARALGGELGATRPVVDAGWVEHGRQVGTTGQVVSPKLYVACGVSGAIHHLAGMKKSEFILAVNKDREAPIGEVADVLAVADLMQLLPALTARLAKG